METPNPGPRQPDKRHGPEPTAARTNNRGFDGWEAANIGARVGGWMIDRLILFAGTIAALVPIIYARVVAMIEVAAVTMGDNLGEEDLARKVIDSFTVSDVAEIAGIGVLIYMAASGLYVISQHALWGSTLGKRMFGVIVITEESGRRWLNTQKRSGVGWWAAFRRWLLPSLSVLGAGVGVLASVVTYSWVFVNPKRRGWHDMVGGTMVVSRNLAKARTATDQPPETTEAQ